MSVRPLPIALLTLLAALAAGRVSGGRPELRLRSDRGDSGAGGGGSRALQGEARGGMDTCSILFQPSGSASDVAVDRGPFVSTRVAKCIVRRFRKVTVPPFDGEAVRVGKNFHID